MNKIIVYEDEGFEGSFKEFTSSVRDLRDVHFNRCISSVKVIGQPWVMFEKPGYKGTPVLLGRGDHECIQLNNNSGSIMLIEEDLEDPQIILFTERSLRGRELHVEEETNLKAGHIKKVLSHEVKRGAWLLYENKESRKKGVVSRAGDRMENYSEMGGRLLASRTSVSYVIPIYEPPIVKVEKILWKDKTISNIKPEEENKECVYFNLCDTVMEVNDEVNFEFQKEFLYTLKSEKSTSFKGEVAIELPEIPFIEGAFSAKRCVKTKKNVTYSQTVAEKRKISVKLSVLPKRKVIFTIVHTETKVSVPVKLAIISANKTENETVIYEFNKSSFEQKTKEEAA